VEKLGEQVVVVEREREREGRAEKEREGREEKEREESWEEEGWEGEQTGRGNHNAQGDRGVLPVRVGCLLI
jgi:hypothetical protein